MTHSPGLTRTGWLVLCGSLAVIVAAPAIWFYALATYGIDVPVFDQWVTPLDQIRAFEDGTLSLADLARQHNEGRKVFPNLLSLGLFVALGRFDAAAELFIGYGLTLVLVALVAVFAYRTLRDPLSAITVTAVFTALMFGTVTVYFRFFSITFERLIPEIALLAIAILFAARGLTPGTAAVASLAAIVAQYSYPGGIAIWTMPFLFAVLVWPRPMSRTLAALAIVLVAAALSSLLYFHGYERPFKEYPATAFLGEPVLDMARFVFIFMGNVVTGRSDVGAAAGLAICVAAALALAHALIFARRDERQPYRAAWLLLAAYSLAQALLAMIGRLAIGMEHASRPDYVVHPVFIVTAVLAYLLMSVPPGWRRPIQTAVVALAVGWTTMLLLPRFWDRLEIYQQPIAEARTCLVLSRLYRDDDCLKRLFPRIDELLGRADAVEDLISARRIAELPPDLAGSVDGTVEEITGGGDQEGGVEASGWAVVDGRPASAVIATTADDRIVGIAAVDGLRTVDGPAGDLPRMRGWNLGVKPPLGSTDPCALTFHAFDGRSGSLGRLDPPARCVGAGSE